MLTDEHEHAMKVWREALGDYSRNPIGSKYDLDMANQAAAAAVIAADRAGLVARIAELEGALKRCAQIVERYNWRQSEKVDDVKIIVHAALKDTRNDA